MTRDELLFSICPGYRAPDCFKGDTSFNCNDCNRVLNEMLDKYDKQIRADAIDDFVHKVKEHHYVLSDVINSTDYGIFTVGIEQIAEELKEGELKQ